MGMRFLTGGESSPKGIIGLAFVLGRSLNGGVIAGIAGATRPVAEKGNIVMKLKDQSLMVAQAEAFAAANKQDEGTWLAIVDSLKKDDWFRCGWLLGRTKTEASNQFFRMISERKVLKP